MDVPFVINGKIENWKSFKWTPTGLCETLKSVKLVFRVGKKDFNNLQFETECSYEEATVDQFVEWLSGQSDASCDVDGKTDSAADTCDNDNPLLQYDRELFWCYADYKYMHDVFKGNKELLNSVDWSVVGLKNRAGKDSTFWLGSNRANTVCHQDTYGCNLVAQIYGRKKWVLFPPSQSQNLYPTRIPYEESSVFSHVNITVPDLTKHSRFKHCTPYVVILEPGDVLYVPRHWWHYVECVDTAISVNTWLEMEEDIDTRLTEAVTKTMVSSLMQCSTVDWLNPTQDEKDTEENFMLINDSLKEAYENVNTSGLQDATVCTDVKDCSDNKDSLHIEDSMHDTDSFDEKACSHAEKHSNVKESSHLKDCSHASDNKTATSPANLFFHFMKTNQPDAKLCKKYTCEEYLREFVYKKTESTSSESLLSRKRKLSDDSESSDSKKHFETTNIVSDTLKSSDIGLNDKNQDQVNEKQVALTETDIVNCFLDSEVVDLICKKLKAKYKILTS